MRAAAAVLLFVVAFAGAGCELVGPRTCTDIAVPGLVVTVVDSVSGERVPDASVVIEDGGYREVVEEHGVVFAAYERSGTYRVEVTAPGYAAWSRDGIRVTADECHVRRVEVTARLRSVWGMDGLRLGRGHGTS